MAPNPNSWDDMINDYGRGGNSKIANDLSNAYSDVRYRVSNTYSDIQNELSNSYSSSRTEYKFPVALVAGIAAGIGLLIMLIVLCCCCCKRCGSRGRVILPPPAAAPPMPAPGAAPYAQLSFNNSPPMGGTAMYPMPMAYQPGEMYNAVAPTAPSGFTAQPVLMPHYTPAPAPAEHPPAYDTDLLLGDAAGGGH